MALPIYPRPPKNEPFKSVRGDDKAMPDHSEKARDGGEGMDKSLGDFKRADLAKGYGDHGAVDGSSDKPRPA